MKALVETLGNYCLHDLLGRQTLQAERPTVVELTPFIESHRGTRLKIIEMLGDEASDAGLALAADDDALEAAIADLPRPTKSDPLDHDGDGRKGGSKPKAK